MARPTRIHRPGDLHYLVLRANAGRELFPRSEDFVEFAALVAHHLDACRIRLLGFCWVREEARFALQVSSEPLGKFVQRVAGQHAQRINRRAGVRGHVFRQRYRTIVVTEPQLPLVVSHLHALPLRLGLAADPADYPWSSHRSYLGAHGVPDVATEPLLRILASGACGAGESYQRITEETMRRLAALADRGTSPADEEREFLRSLAPAARRGSGDLGRLDRLIDQVADRLAVRSDELRSRSRRRVLSLGRAVVAWHAVHSGTTRLSEVARYLRRHPSTLSIAIERYRVRRPDLFSEPLDGEAVRGPPRPSPESGQ